jgi:hypothetical protein
MKTLFSIKQKAESKTLKATQTQKALCLQPSALRRGLWAVAGGLLAWSCSNIEDATPSERKTFIRFYEAPHNVSGITAEPVDNGFVILAS